MAVHERSPSPHDQRTASIATTGREVVERVACSLEQLGASLSRYDDALADEAQAHLRVLAVTCGAEADVAARVQWLADQIGIAYFARFAADAANIARSLAGACDALASGVAAGHAAAAAAFIAEALECAADTRFATQDLAAAAREIDRLVHAIGSRCKRTLDVTIPARIRTHCIVAPMFHFFIHPHIGEGSLALATLRLPGGHYVMPSAFVLPAGPVLGFAT